MAFRTWVRLLLATLGVGALAGASQLGVAYGLGILRLTRVLDVTTRDQWTAQLAWVAWFAMMAAVVGALAGAWLLPRWSPTRPGTGTTVAIALAAGLGAAVVVPLTMQPARTAQVAGVHPVFVIGICAGLGALAGVFAAAGALIQPVSRWGLTTLGISIWVIAIISVSPSLAPDDPLPAVRLGVFDAGFLSPAVTQRTALFTMPALALIVGALLGWIARRRELPMLTIALAGLPGPALLTVAYLIAGPGSGADRYQVVPYWAAMTATGAGVLGSVLAAVLRRGGPEQADDGNAPTEDRPPLPRRTGQAESAIARAGAAPPEPDATEPISSPGTRVPAPRTGPETGPGDAPSGRPSRSDDSTGSPGSGEPAGARGSGEPAGGRPRTLGDTLHGGRPGNGPGGVNAPDTSPVARTGGVALGEHPGFPTPGGLHAAAEPKPYVPAPAIRPLPPEVLGSAPSEPPSRLANTRLGRSLRPFSRGHVDQPAGDLDLSRRSDRRGRGKGRLDRDQDRLAHEEDQRGRNGLPHHEDQPGRDTDLPAHDDDRPSRGRNWLSRGKDKPGRDEDRPGRHDAAVLDEQPSGDPTARKRRGWRRGKASETIDQTDSAPPAGLGGLGAPRPHASDVPPAPLSPPSTDRTSPLEPFQPVPSDRAYPMDSPARPSFAGAPIRDDRTPAGRPFAPEPQSISAPLPKPEPITPPIPTPEPVLPPADKRRSSKQQRKDDDYVDWVSGLGGE